jgi:hypothetical protein
MQFALVPKTKSTLVDIDIQSLKKGQTEVVPAVALTFKTTLANDKLALLDVSLLGFLYEKNSAAQTQGTLDGVPVVSSMPSLTAAAKALGALSWDGEQTGCKLVIYQGATGAADIHLKDGEVDKVKLDPKEGGAVDFTWRFYTAAVDAETLGELGVLKSHEVDVELTLPEALQQQIDSKKDGAKKGAAKTPEQAFTETEPQGA